MDILLELFPYPLRDLYTLPYAEEPDSSDPSFIHNGDKTIISSSLPLIAKYIGICTCLSSTRPDAEEITFVTYVV